MVDTRGTDAGTARRIGRLSGGIILIGGILSALAYWLLPVAEVPLVGSVSAPELVGQVSDGGSFGLLRLVPWTVLLIILAGAWLLARSAGPGRPVLAVVALICALATGLAYLVPLGKVDQALDSAGADSLGIQATSLTGGGFWLALIGAVVALVGAVVELATGRSRR